MTTVIENICLRCGHEWEQQGAEPPGQCPSCHSGYWDRPPKYHRKKVTT